MRYATLAAIVIALDQYTKVLARGLTRTIFAGPLTIIYTENSGAFLSLGENLPAGVRAWLFNVVVGIGLIALATYLFRHPDVPLTLVLAGGVGNLIDRLRFSGRVTDFLYLHAGPLHTGVFNVADMAITAGALWMLGSWFVEGRNDAARQPLESHEQQHGDNG